MAKSPFQRLKDNVRDIFDANTQADQQRRVAQGRPAQYKPSFNNPVGAVQRTVQIARDPNFRAGMGMAVNNAKRGLAGGGEFTTANLLDTQLTKNPFIAPVPQLVNRQMQRSKGFEAGVNKMGNTFVQNFSPQKFRSNTEQLLGTALLARNKNDARGIYLESKGRKGRQTADEFSQQAQQMTTGNGTLDTGLTVGSQLMSNTISPFAGAFNTTGDVTFSARQAGVSPRKSLVGGVVTGGVDYVGNKLSTQSVAGKYAAGAKGARGALTRTGIATVTNAGDNAFQQTVQNLVAQKTFDPNRRLGDNVPQSALMGAAMGGGLRGAGELSGTVRNIGKADPTKPTMKDLTNALDYIKDRGKPVDDALHAERLDSIRKFGIDPTKPEAWTQLDQLRIGAQSQGGYIKNPLAKDPLESLKQERTKLVQENMGIDYSSNPQSIANSIRIKEIDALLAQPSKSNPKAIKDDLTATSNSTKTTDQLSSTALETPSSPANQSTATGRTAQKQVRIDRTPSNDLVDPVSSSKSNPLQTNDESIIPPESYFANDPDPGRPADTFDAVATTKGSKNAKRLEQVITESDELNKAAIEARTSGNELNYFAKKDTNGRSVGIERFDPRIHTIEAGLVLDKDGRVLGNHIKVDETGIQVNVGGEIVSMNNIVGNPQDWSGNYKMMETMDRNIKNNAPDEATYRKTRRFLIDHKIKNEAVFKEELVAQRKALSERAKTVQATRPRGVSKDEFNSDIFDFIEGKKTDADIDAKYGQGASAIKEYKASTQALYDDLLDRVNETFIKFGEAPVPKRADYITHINELMQKPSFAGEMFGQLQNSILGEGNVTTRSSVPANIAGRTENFKPNKRWNRFFQQRNNGEFTKDPFKAVDAYLEPTLYNIHMTESAVRARAVEAAFRTAEELRQLDKNTVSETLGDSLKQYTGGDNSKLVTGFQEYANALAGKTQRFDRQIIDSSKGGELGLKGWQGLQRVGGRATILGNVQSVLSQTLNQPMAFADAGAINYIKGIASSLTGSTPASKSPFIRARQAITASPFRGTGTKVMDAGGVPLREVEMAMVELTWNAEYHKAVSKGYKGQEAILEADRLTEQVVGGRGIADMPEAYRSTFSNGFLQYTLEVSATNKKFFQDLTPAQKGKYMVAVLAANSVMGAVTGYEPLPDFLGAAIDTYGDFTDEEDERNSVQKLTGATQRFAGEAVEMNPLASAAVNGLLSQDQRKNIFGEESSVSRFEGTAAPVAVIRNSASAAKNVTEGDWVNARNDALRNVPFGNQARKTITGAETIDRGYAVDSQGKPTFAAPKTVAGKAQTLVFGPTSTADAKSFYNTDQRGLSKKQTEALNALPKEQRAGYIEAIRNGKDEKTITITKNGLPVALDTLPPSEQFIEINKRFKDASNPEEQAQAQKVITIKRDEMSAELNKMLKESGLPEVKPSLNVAETWAKYDQKLKKGEISNLTAQKELRKVIKDAYVNELDSTGRQLYGLSKSDLYGAIENGMITQEQMDKAMKLDQYLYEKGVSGSLEFSNTIRRDLGYNEVDSKTSGKGKTGGKGKKAKKISIGKGVSLAKYMKPVANTSSKTIKINPNSIIEKSKVQIKKKK